MAQAFSSDLAESRFFADGEAPALSDAEVLAIRRDLVAWR